MTDANNAKKIILRIARSNPELAWDFTTIFPFSLKDRAELQVIVSQFLPKRTF